MTIFLVRLAEVFVALVVFDGLIVALIAGCNLVERLWHRRHFSKWEAELAESAREAAKRRHPAGGRQ